MGKTFVIGVAGGSASGKTTFAKALQGELEGYSLKLVHMDSYFKAEADRPCSKAPITGKVYMDDNHPLTMDLPRLADDLRGWIGSGEYDVIVVEGLLTLWEESIDSQLDLRLFVDCRDDERIARRIKRNMRWGQTLEQITDVYLDLVRYRHDEFVAPTKWKADLILNGSNPSPKALAAVRLLVSEEID